MTTLVSPTPVVVTAVEIVAGDPLTPAAVGPVRAVAVALASAADGVRAGADLPVGPLLVGLRAAEEALAGPARLARHHASAEAAAAESEALGRIGDETVVYDHFFGVGRASELTAVEEVATALSCLTLVVADLDRCRLAHDYVADVLDLFARMLGELTPAAHPAGAALPADPGTEPTLDQLEVPRVRPLDRWWLGHQVYAMANRRAARLLRVATTATGPQLEHALVRAAVEVGALTAALTYTAAMSSRQYQEDVRHTMAEPNLELELTGRMNLDHATYRAALAGFLAAHPASYDEVAATDPRVAAARERVLDQDLHDMGCHVELTHRLVGTAAALDEQEHGSAVQALRSMELDRRQQYVPYLRLGSRLSRPRCPDPSVHADGPAGGRR